MSKFKGSEFAIHAEIYTRNDIFVGMIIYLVVLGKFRSGHELTLAKFCLYKKFQATDTSAHTTKVWAQRDIRRVGVSVAETGISQSPQLPKG